MKLLGIRLEDKPQKGVREASATQQKSGGLLRKSLGSLFKDKQPNTSVNQTLNESQKPAGRASLLSKVKGRLSLNRSSVVNNDTTVTTETQTPRDLVSNSMLQEN